MQPVVRLRFLVALLVVVGVVASGAAAVAASKAEEAHELRTAMTVNGRVHQAPWPDGYRLVREADGCVAGARDVCLVTDDEPADAVRTVTEVLPVSRTGSDDRTIGEQTRHLLGGTIDGQELFVTVQPHRTDDRDHGPHDFAGASIAVSLLSGDDD